MPDTTAMSKAVVRAPAGSRMQLLLASNADGSARAQAANPYRRHAQCGR